ncbi:SH3 domain-containing protein [Quillaja saponaria]|uniref:SH3 domain-containing protein n=1 Tax=Quillaja saponaria TaxID=32244 RepID=A0AAD7Q2I5_QUISA|nr:SH3 domain-containing protein [Quillaja saponaria]
MALAKLVQPGGALQDVLHLHDVLARVSLARLCHTVSRARALDERPDITSKFNSVLYQLLLDPSERVCFEAILCVLGKYDNTERTEERAAGWYRLTRETLKLPEAPSKEASKDKSQKTKRLQSLIKLVMRRLESCFHSFSRPVLHAAARVVQEMGKSRAAAFALGLQDIDEGAHVNTFPETGDLQDSDESAHPESIRRTASVSNGTGGRDTIASLLASLMEVVRTTVACECVYVRAMVIKALVWMQSPVDSFDKLESIIASELSDPAWPATLLNDILLTLHAHFKASPDMAVTLLEIARIFATKVPGKIDADVLQLLWKTCLVGAVPGGKHTALEAVTIVLDLPPPQPGSMLGFASVDMVSASDPKSALALQRLVQAAVWFLGENANYAASEYAWESATPPGTALMMLDADKMVAAASSRNPTLAGALTRLQRCAFSGSWEIRVIAAQALTTLAIRSGEPFRLQIYEFLHTLAQGGVQSQFSEMHLSNGEDQGASGTGVGVLISPMIKILDEMYRAQDDLIKEIRNHDNAKKEWTDEELKKLYETHERLLDLVSLFCYVPRAKYLPLGPISAKLIDIYRTRHNIIASTGLSDPAVATGISDLVYESKLAPAEAETLDDDLVNAWAANLGDDGLWGNNAPAKNRVNEFLAGAGTDAPDVDEENIISRPSVSYDDMWAKTLLESSELEEDDARSLGSSSPDSTGSVETSISSHSGGMSYPSLFSSKPSTYGVSQTSERTATSKGGPSIYKGLGSPIREESSLYSSPVSQSFESSENPLVGRGSQSFGSQDDEQVSSGSSVNPQSGTALYDFSAGGDDELNLTAGEEVEIEYEVDGWFYVKKKRPGRDGKMAGLVPVLYVNQS